jgi:hypothetical protein
MVVSITQEEGHFWGDIQVNQGRVLGHLTSSVFGYNHVCVSVCMFVFV